MPRKARLVLPTRETCVWRKARDAGGASCQLLESFVGEQFSAVAASACDACCESFPPSEQKLNPVVASLLYHAARQVLAAGGTEACSIERASDIQRLTSRSLSIVHGLRHTALPARTKQACCWLGDPISAERQSVQHLDEREHYCAHPDYQRTTKNQCRKCREWTGQPPMVPWLSLEELIPLPEQRLQRSVSRWAVGVTTSPRRTPTLELCLDSLARAGWLEPRLFFDGTAHVPPRYARLPMSWREDGIGAWPAWYMGLAELVLLQPDADAYMMVQDDVVLFDRQSLRQYLERALWPTERAAVVSLFYTAVKSETGWFDAKGAWHFSAQGLIFSPAAARSLLADAVLAHAWLTARADAHVPIPEMIHDWSVNSAIDVWYTNPSLVQHIGNTSTIWMDAGITDGRRASWYSGSVETVFSAEETLADFPEDAFACPKGKCQEYLVDVAAGRLRMQESAVVICGLARDVRLHLPRTAARIERLGEMFGQYKVVLFENDSSDRTVEFLQHWKATNPHVEFSSQQLQAKKFGQCRSLERSTWLAICRNQYRESIVRRYSEFDYVIVVDTDLPGGWSFDGLAHTFAQNDWDFVGSYGIQRRPKRIAGKLDFYHHDVWAFRPAVGTAARKLVDHCELELSRGDPLLRVDSCFGGLGVYRMACMKAARYEGYDCEHVAFHANLQRAGLGRLYLNPNQIVLYAPA